MTKDISNKILSILKEEIKNPKPELNFNNNYELLVAVLLSSQTTDKRVNEVTKVLFDKYKNVYELKEAFEKDIYEIIKPLGFANVKSRNLVLLANDIVLRFNGNIPNNLSDLESLAGVGHKTASVVLALGFNISAFPVDTHLLRMAKRFGYIDKNGDVLDAEKAYKKYIDSSEWILAHHLFLLFGRYTCKSKNPNCINCKLKNYCKKEL